MMTLQNAQQAARWLVDRARTGRGQLRGDSRQVRPGDAFVAWPGAARDGRQFVRQALADGAAACLMEAQGVEAFGLEALDTADGARVATLRGLKAAAGVVADAWFDHPTRQWPVLAVTGTNGKTSTAWWLAQALTACGRRSGVVGTLGVGVPPDLISTGLTTPDPITLQSAFADFKHQGFAACAIEASSIGIAEERLAGTQIAVALFTNFTQDHLDYHGSMAAYWAAKRRLFDWPGLQAAVVNLDDPQGALLAAELAGSGTDARGLALWTVSARADARLRALDVRYESAGLAFELIEGSQRMALRSALIGDYNVHNLLVVLGGLRAMGVPLEQAVAAVPALQPVPGRMQRVPRPTAEQTGPDVVVDYAHTPDALEKVLQSLRPLATARGGVLWCVFGCGGDRDPGKRPLMGAIAASLADQVIITSDNPRGEQPDAIVQQIKAGVPQQASSRTRVTVDRREAIRLALQQAAPGDVVVIAGKGHEDYQEVAGIRWPFSDAQEARKALEERAP